MKFVVEALGLTAAGGKELAVNVLPRFSNHTQHQFVLLLPDLPEYRAVQGGNLSCLYFPKSHSLLKRYLFLNRTVPRICSEQKADTLLCMGNFAPRTSSCPAAVLFQNLYLLYEVPRFGEHLTLREKLIVAYGKRACRRLLPRVTVIVQTEVVRERLVGIYGLDPRKVIVVPSSCPFPLNGEGDFGEEQKDPSRPFTFLCASPYKPHKNFEVLVEALQRLRAYTPRLARCFITISADQHPGARRLLRRIERENLAQQIVNLGWIPTREGLAQVYRSADAYIFPSLMETFSFTYLEAMCFGLPILTSDRDFARDRCQDAAVYFDPLDPESVAKCMARILEDGALRNKLVSRAKFLLEKVPSWEKVAAQFVAVLERVSGGAALSTCNGTLDA